MLLSKNKEQLFFVGIGGIGMSALAQILLENGYKISGSDQTPNKLTQLLKDKGATIYNKHVTTNISKDIDLLVYSSAISDNNPEIQEAIRKKIPVIKRAEMLAELMDNKYGIAVAGTHGKTTTTSMISFTVIEAGLDPTITVGGILRNLKTNARLGKSKYFITEADEYDRSFLTLKPNMAVITNIESDHLDCYKNINNIKNSFIEFTNHVAQNGVIICNKDNHAVREIMPEISRKVMTYGINEEAEYRASNIRFSEDKSRFSVYNKNNFMGDINLNIPGSHNINNALATIVFGIELGISFQVIQHALSLFSGVERRFEIKGIVNNIMVIDDYAHHPSEVAATLDGIKNGWNNRLIVIFQPHLYSRTKDFYKEFANQLQKADIVIITDIYAAREKPLRGVSGKMIADWLTKMGKKEVHYVKDLSLVIDHLSQIVQPGDMVITMGAGDIWKVSDQLVEKLNEKISHSLI
jgi:UDP-N-acetylmuramate--alanine ligase